MSRTVLSVVIPAYNEEKRIRKTLSRLFGYLDRLGNSFEVIAVDDGSSDGTFGILKEIAAGHPALRIARNETNHGKGYAVRQGILMAKGDIIFFTDADLSTPPKEIGRFIRLIQETKADVLIGSRSVAGAKIKIRQPWYRQSMGKVFNWFVRILTPLRFSDTQCGFKMFRRKAAHEIFGRAKQNGFAFDVEILLLARQFGFKVEEVPVTWVNNHQSKVGPVSDSLRMFYELLEIRRISQTQ